MLGINFPRLYWFKGVRIMFSNYLAATVDAGDDQATSERSYLKSPSMGDAATRTVPFHFI